MAPQKIDSFSFLDGSAKDAAPRLLGCILERTINDTVLSGRIVETEAYDQSDIASHSHKGETERTKVMFGPSGRLYVYFTYGMHYCCNVVVGSNGHGAAVLIRALEPLNGIVAMRKYREGRSDLELTNGPAKLCQAMQIDRQMNGHDLRSLPLRLIFGHLKPNDKIVKTGRIGISRAKDVPWRFYIKNNPYISKP